MLIDFIGENITNSTFTASPHLYELLQDCEYEFGCWQIILKLKTNQMTETQSLWALKTNLVDRCSANPNRAVSYFFLDANKSRYIIDFPSVGYYPLERIHTYPQFEIANLWDDQSLEISNVIVKANIRKTCSGLANPSRL